MIRRHLRREARCLYVLVWALAVAHAPSMVQGQAQAPDAAEKPPAHPPASPSANPGPPNPPANQGASPVPATPIAPADAAPSPAPGESPAAPGGLSPTTPSEPDAEPPEAAPDEAASPTNQAAPPVAPAMPAPPPATPSHAASESSSEERAVLDVDASALLDSDVPIEVIVIGTRIQEAPGSAHAIGEKELERFEYDDPTAVLTSVPGVYSRTEDGMGLRPNIGIRGVNPDRSKKITLLEDGILFGPAPYSAPAAYYFPIITRMSEVRVIKGPSAVAYGPQTVGGAIDLATRPIPDAPTGSLDIAAGEYGYGKAHGYFGASDEQAGFVLEGVHLQNHGFKQLPNDADTGAVRNEWMAKGSYVLDPRARVRNELRLKLSYTDEISNETYLGLSPQDFAKTPYRRYGASALDQMKNHRISAVLTHLVEFSDSASLSTVLYRHDFSRVWRRVNGFAGADLFDVLTRDGGSDARAGIYQGVLNGEQDSDVLGTSDALLLATNARDFVSEGIESRGSFSAKRGELSHRLEYGLRLHYDKIERRHTEDRYDVSTGQPSAQAAPTVLTTFNKAATYALAPHVTYALTIRELTITPGIRTELMRMSLVDRATGDKRTGFSYAVLPGLGAYYGITEQLGVLAGVYRGFSPPPPGSKKGIDPEYSVNYEAGARYNDGPLRGELIGFFNDYSNLTNICTSSGGGCNEDSLDQQSDAGRAFIYGVEAVAAHEFSLGQVALPLSASYTYTRAEFRQSFSSVDPVFGDVERGDPLPYLPEHQLRASAGVEAKLAGGSLALVYVARMSEGTSPLDGARLYTDDQTLVDASAWARVWGPFQVYANAQNVFDSTYLVARRPFGARPNAPRWVHVGIKAAF